MTHYLETFFGTAFQNITGGHFLLADLFPSTDIRGLLRHDAY
jgi:hypothetical protein